MKKERGELPSYTTYYINRKAIFEIKPYFRWGKIFVFISTVLSNSE